MKLKCLVLGCKWKPGISWWCAGEKFQNHTCERCGANKTEAV